MNKKAFLQVIQVEVTAFNSAVATAEGDWIVKGFIDIAKNIYTISVDTKVISKIMELLLFPELAHFSEKHDLWSWFSNRISTLTSVLSMKTAIVLRLTSKARTAPMWGVSTV